MKNLKILMVALVLLALPAFAFGQDVSCEACTHDVSVFMGEGGLVATADGAEKVTYVTTCSGVTRSGELTANDDGKVSMLFSMDNGLACSATGKDMGSFQIGPVKDGGWFWITDDMNSAVGALVANDIQKNDMVEITSAGAGVTMTAGTGAVYLKETATGRVGILPTIVAEPPTPAPTKCGFTGSFTTKSPGVPKNTSCMLGDGGTRVVATSTNAITGSTVQIMNKGSVTRPSGSGQVSIVVDLWGNGSGHYVATHAEAGNGISAGRGHAAFVGTAGRASTRLQGVTYAVNVGQAGGVGSGAAVTPGNAEGGVDYTSATNSNVATITVAKDAAYCSKDNNHTATVTVTATVAEASLADVVPAITKNAKSSSDLTANDVHEATLVFNVGCPAGASSSSHEGVELIPENLFPTE